MKVVQLTYTVRFLCPAFLGNAEQSGQWRTPPFKALLRQWWRIAYAADHGFSINTDDMRVAEGQLFGAAAEKESSNSSRIRVRLDKWEPGRMKFWQSVGNVTHPEVGQIDGGLYLGYGPLTSRTALKAGAAIQAGESATLRLALSPSVGDEERARIAEALALMNLYGTLGGRSRNGWGSFALEPSGGYPALPLSLDQSFLHPWREALGLDWPHAIGQDSKGPLIWQTEEAFSDWKAAMRRLAAIKIGLRTQFKFRDEKSPHPGPNERHWLSYPVTRHAVAQWGNSRLPNSLRFKLRGDRGDPIQLRSLIFHVPCMPPSVFKPDSRAVQRIWERVHQFLDHPAQRLGRIDA
jgi:CRISPR-associated protein Cmr1